MLHARCRDVFKAKYHMPAHLLHLSLLHNSACYKNQPAA